MIQVTVTDFTSSDVIVQATLDTQPHVDAWIAQNIAAAIWGKPSRILIAQLDGTAVDYDGSVPDLTGAIVVGTSVVESTTVNVYLIPAEYVIAQVSV